MQGTIAHPTNYRRPGSFGAGRRLAALGMAGGATLVAMAMMMAPIASAHTPVTYSAPYLKAVVSNSNYQSTNGCATLHATKLHFSVLTGIGNWAGKATSKTCPRSLAGVGSYSSAFAEPQTQVAIPVKAFFGHHTATTVAVTWSITGAASMGVTLGGVCPPAVVNPTTGYGYSYCSLYSSAEVFGFSYLIDLTNGSYFYPSNYPTFLAMYNSTYNDTYCYSFTCYSYNSSYSSGPSSFSGTTSATWWINGTLDHADKYAVWTYLYAYVSTSIQGYPKSSASAMIDLASSGNNMDLASIVMS